MAQEKKEKKVKRPSALKRDLQNEKRRLKNRSFRSSVTTAIRSLKESVAKKDSAAVQEKLNEIYSIVDKGVKTGVYKEGKGSRTKSRLAAFCALS